MSLIGEVIEVTVTTQSIHESEIRKNMDKLAVLRKMEDDIKAEEKIRVEQYNEAKEAAKKAEEFYYQAMNEIPTSFEAMLQEIPRLLINAIPAIALTKFFPSMGGIPAMAGDYKGNAGSTGGVAVTMGNHIHKPGSMGGQPSMMDNNQHYNDSPDMPMNSATNSTQSVGYSQTLLLANQFSEVLQSFLEGLSKNLQNSTLLKDFVKSGSTFEHIILSLGDNSAKVEVLNLIQRSANITDTTLTGFNQKKSGKAKSSTLVKQLQQIAEDLKLLLSAARYANPTLAADNIMKVENSKDSHSTQSSKNELYKARLAQANLVEMKRIQDKQAQEHLALVTEMRHLSSQMVGINFTTINYEKIVEMLQETLVLLSRLREQWNHFVRFYSHISNQITAKCL
ncbi:unnamed protein product [Rotaria sp. Silwood1]|nr:unnamed protein product [Rotaria sp. Silwood1]